MFVTDAQICSCLRGRKLLRWATLKTTKKSLQSGQILPYLERRKANKLSASGASTLTLDQGLCPWTLMGAPPQTPIIRSRSALAIRPYFS